MNCRNCKSIWYTVPEIAEKLKNCPFCGYELIPKITVPKQTLEDAKKNISSAIGYVVGKYGLDVLDDKQKMCANLFDICPSMRKERRRVCLAYSFGIPSILKESLGKDKSSCTTSVMSAVNLLMNEADLSENAANETVRYFADAFGWNVQVKNNAESWAETALEAYMRDDYRTAIRFAQLASDLGNGAAQNILGECYYWGHGVNVDEYKAVEWYMKAGSNGDANALCSLGDCYASGVGVVQDLTKAKQFYSRSAMLGNKRAELEIGRLH